MQSVGFGMRSIPRRRVVHRLPPIASTSRGQWESLRNYAWNPLEWFRKTSDPSQKQAKVTVQEKRTLLPTSKPKEVTGSVFETLEQPEEVEEGNRMLRLPQKQKPTSHKYSTATMKVSHRKLNMLGHQIAGKPIDIAILQMDFSEKRVSNRIKTMLVTARDHAMKKGLERNRLVVSEAWVNKGPGGRQAKRIEIKGRGRMGIRTKPKARMHVVLAEGKTLAQLQEEARQKRVRRTVSASLVREDQPLRNPPSSWAW